MIHRNTLGNAIWVDMISPTQKEIDTVLQEFNIPKDAGNDLARPSIRPKFASFGEASILVLHFPSISNKKIFQGARIKEIDFLISSNVIITTRYELFSPIDNFIHEISENGDAGKLKVKSPSDVFYVVMKRLYDFLLDETESVEHKLRSAEEKIFRGAEKEMVETLSVISREIIDFKNSMNHHLEVIGDFEYQAKTQFDSQFESKIKEIINICGKIETSIGRSNEFLNELRITNDSLLSAKQNDVMKRFTILAFIFLPLNFISALFGMNAKNMPIIGLDNDFYILLLLAAFVGCCTYVYFKLKRWL